MAKNLLINIDNSLSGIVELWASSPMSNGIRQTAPVFVESHHYKNGTITLSGLQETPASKSWHYRLFVIPDGAECGSRVGSMQYRFYLPTSAPSTANLISLEKAW